MIAQYLGRGKQNAMTREQLVELSGLDDRAVRNGIKQLRENGELICNDCDGKGYYIAATDEEIKRLLWIYAKRIWTMIKIYRKMKKNAVSVRQERIVA